MVKAEANVVDPPDKVEGDNDDGEEKDEDEEENGDEGEKKRRGSFGVKSPIRVWSLNVHREFFLSVDDDGRGVSQLARQEMRWAWAQVHTHAHNLVNFKKKRLLGLYGGERWREEDR